MKMQLPPIGGIRKVLKTNAQSGGTTIAEIGNGTVTLEQLAALIFNLLTNTGTVNTGGQGQVGVLVPGAGLSGGGVLTGNVPIYLTAPIPALLAEDGQDGDVGPPGQRGATGAQGIPGAFLLAEDGQDGDIGPPGAAGATGATGPQGPAGSGTGSGGTGTLMMFVPEDTSDNDTGFLVPGPAGPQGPQGVQGSQGAAGTGSGGASTGPQIWIPEDTSYDDTIDVPIPSSLGDLSINGSEVINGLLSVIGASSGVVLSSKAGSTLLSAALQLSNAASGSFNILSSLNGTSYLSMSLGGTQPLWKFQNAASNILTVEIQGQGTLGQSYGLGVLGGTNASDYCAIFEGQSGGSEFMRIWGDGGVTIGSVPVPADEGIGTLNAGKGLFVAGIPVALGQPGNITRTYSNMIPEDPDRNDDGMCTPPPSSSGPLTMYGPLNATYAVIANAGVLASSVAARQNTALSINQAGQTPWQIYQPASDNSLRIGTTATDILILSSGANGSLLVSSAVKTGTLSVTAAIPAVTAAQTDIGITTTATVITTAGGIALPALASTFWVVNVNGVAYGIPCFAL